MALPMGPPSECGIDAAEAILAAQRLGDEPPLLHAVRRLEHLLQRDDMRVQRQQLRHQTSMRRATPRCAVPQIERDDA